MQHGGLLFTTHGPVDSAGKILQEGIEAQTRLTLDNLGRALAAGGCTFADVLQVTIYLLDVADMAKVDEVYRSYFKPPYPVRASLIVAGLVAPGMRIELNAVAAKSAA
jgi:enamine deaminase RidA (YjgF/YER057c/UK114 family)